MTDEMSIPRRAFPPNVHVPVAALLDETISTAALGTLLRVWGKLETEAMVTKADVPAEHLRELEAAGYTERDGSKTVFVDLFLKCHPELFLRLADKEQPKANPILRDSRTTTVYAIADGDMVKIGRARDPKGRVRTLQTGHHQELKLIWSMEAPEFLEGLLHASFADRRVRGEWFRFKKGEAVSELIDSTARAWLSVLTKGSK